MVTAVQVGAMYGFAGATLCLALSCAYVFKHCDLSLNFLQVWVLLTVRLKLESDYAGAQQKILLSR